MQITSKNENFEIRDYEEKLKLSQCVQYLKKRVISHIDELSTKIELNFFDE